MRLKGKRTWSQHQLAVKLRLEPGESHGPFTWERRRVLIHASKTALAAALGWWLALRLGLRDGYWGPISSIIVMQSNVGATVTASRDRLLGTLIGAVIGIAFSFLRPLWLGYILALFVALVICGLFGLRNSSRLAGVTITIVMLVRGGAYIGLAIDRVSEVALGIVVALAVTTFVFPDRARLRLRDGLAQEFLLLGTLFEGVLEGFHGAPSQNLPQLRDEVRSSLRGNAQLLDAARHEPSGGPGWREGLVMLSQFGSSLFEIIGALELSVEGSHEDAYAQQLEPELGRLAVHIRDGFNHVASCIHKWRFDLVPQGFNLEEDIASLEARMETVRHTGIGFSQAEILRAYAVQLHLKQIARLLRASRVETDRAVREAAE